MTNVIQITMVRVQMAISRVARRAYKIGNPDSIKVRALDMAAEAACLINLKLIGDSRVQEIMDSEMRKRIAGCNVEFYF